VNNRDSLDRLYRIPSPLRVELEQRANRDQVPLIPYETARLLSTLVHAMQANRILEIGTAYGDSTLVMALAMSPAGRLWTIDPDPTRTEVARDFLVKAGKAEATIIMNQAAVDVLPTFPQRNLDIIFMNAIQTKDRAFLNVCVPLLKRSGMLIVDGMLSQNEATHPLDEFTQSFLEHAQLDATIVPVGNGVGLGARIA
jgi:predicted O-methyltransferase YrrM